MMKIIMAEYGDWDSIFNLGSHYLCERFLEQGATVLWFRSYWSMFTPVVAWRGFKASLSQWSIRPVRLKKNLYGFSPLTLLPYRNLPGFRSGTVGSNVLRLSVPPLEWWLKRNNWHEPDLLWVTAADLVTLPELVKYRSLVYRITDNYAAFDHIPPGFTEFENRLIRRADVVITTFGEAFERAKSMRKNGTHLLPNAADLKRFATTKSSSIVKEIPSPRVMYLGSLEYWVDHDLIYRTATLRPEYSFVLAGPPPRRPLASLAKLGSLANVHFLGGVKHQLVPGLLQEADVAIIPYVRDPHTHNSSPLKLYEYLAAGLPVVSTPLKEVIASEAPVLFGRSAEEFAAAIDNALTMGKGRQEFLDFALENTWEKRLSKIEDILIEQGLQGFAG